MKRWLVLLLVALLALTACDGPQSSSAKFEVPSRAEFAPVSDLLHARCGSLDCHGQVGRSLRIYGTNGLRLATGDVPGLDGGVTSDAEHDANYASVVELEPELLAQVTREHGKDPERLTLVRKAHGAEHHKGGAPIKAGGLADQCLLGWLEGTVDANLCEEQARVAQPPGF